MCSLGVLSPVAACARPHKKEQDFIRQLDSIGLLADSQLLVGDDQRAIAFLQLFCQQLHLSPNTAA